MDGGGALVVHLSLAAGFASAVNGNLSILSALLLVTALLVMRSGQDPLAGFLLVLAALRGEALVLLIIFILIYSASVQRWTLFWSIVGSFFLLIAATSLLLPIGSHSTPGAWST